MMETKEQKPWYHGVKWSLDIKSAVSSVFVTNEPGKHITSLPVGAGWWHDGDRKAAWLASQDGLEAQLIAAAPETATQRDALLSEVEELKAEVRRLEQGEQGVNVEGLKELAAEVGQKNYDLLSVQKQLVDGLENAKFWLHKLQPALNVMASQCLGDIIKDHIDPAILAAKESS